MSMSEAEAAMAHAQFAVVEKHAYDADGKLLHPRLLERYRHQAAVALDYAGHEEAHSDNLHAHFDLILKAVTAGRTELLRLHRQGRIDEEAFQELEHDLDLEEMGALAAKA